MLAILILSLFIVSPVLNGYDHLLTNKKEKTPKYLYKLLSVENWKASESQNFIKLPEEDQAFIHFSTEAQLDKIIKKYWTHVPEFIVLKVETAKLKGTMIFETNPGGTNKYYHLYNGSIPQEAIVESVLVQNEKQ